MPDYYLVITDGGKKNGLTYGSFRVFNSEGLTISHKSFIMGLGSSNQAEYMALLNALKWCLENDITRINVLTDSKLMVKQVKRLWHTHNRALAKLADRARRYVEDFDEFSIEYVPNKYIKQKLGH